MSVDGRMSGSRMPREQRRAQVLEAAREVFVAQGYHAASMDVIAERAGVSKPVLYQHFPGKLDLYLALLDAGLADLGAAVDAAIASTSDNKMRVQATMQAYFAFVDDPQSAFRLVFESDLSNEPSVRNRVEKVDLAVSERIAAVIAEDTGLSPDQAFILGAGLMGMAVTGSRLWLRGDVDVSREEAASLTAALAWRGISGFPLSHPPTS